jgi:hypothetical protein
LTRGFLFRGSVPLLDSAGELIVPAGELALWIMGEPAPRFFHFPAELLPVAFKTFPVHVDLLLLRMPAPDVAGQRGREHDSGQHGTVTLPFPKLQFGLVLDGYRPPRAASNGENGGNRGAPSRGQREDQIPAQSHDFPVETKT